jgi:3-methyladenine DNA glycosylase AlkD
VKQELSPHQAAEEIILYLKKLADPQFAQQSQRFFKEPVSLLGIPSAELRRQAKQFFQEIKNFWTLNQVLEFSRHLFSSPYVEVRALAILVLSHNAHFFEKHHLAEFKSWLANNYFDNWALVDLFCPNIISPLLDKNPEIASELLQWTTSTNLWVRRSAAVSFIRPVRTSRFLAEAYQVAKRLFSDKEDLIQKAVGWLLREAGKTDMRRLEKFLLRHGPLIPRTTLRYAIERFPENKRKELLKKTRPK